MNAKQIEDLLFKLQQNTLIGRLDSYLKSGSFSFWGGFKNPLHKKRAHSFQLAVKNTTHLDEMNRLVCKQHRLFSGLDQHDAQGETALIVAIKQGEYGPVEKLLKVGANPNQAELKTKRTPLAVAVLAQRPDLIQLLLEYHARIDLQDAYGDTPYHLAVKNKCHDDILDSLVAAPTRLEPCEHEKPLENYTRDAYYSTLNCTKGRLG